MVACEQKCLYNLLKTQHPLESRHPESFNPITGAPFFKAISWFCKFYWLWVRHTSTCDGEVLTVNVDQLSIDSPIARHYTITWSFGFVHMPKWCTWDEQQNDLFPKLPGSNGHPDVLERSIVHPACVLQFSEGPALHSHFIFIKSLMRFSTVLSMLPSPSILTDNFDRTISEWYSFTNMWEDHRSKPQFSQVLNQIPNEEMFHICANQIPRKIFLWSWCSWILRRKTSTDSSRWPP